MVDIALTIFVLFAGQTANPYMICHSGHQAEISSLSNVPSPMGACEALCSVEYEACVSLCDDTDGDGDEEETENKEKCEKECQLEKGRCELECEM